MDYRIKRKWISALKSKRYKQGFGSLKSIASIQSLDAYCPLGVLTDLYAQANKLDAWPTGWWEYVNAPPEVRDWSGIKDTTCQTIVGLNDRSHWTFEEIAEFLSKYKAKEL